MCLGVGMPAHRFATDAKRREAAFPFGPQGPSGRTFTRLVNRPAGRSTAPWPPGWTGSDCPSSLGPCVSDAPGTAAAKSSSTEQRLRLRMALARAHLRSMGLRSGEQGRAGTRGCAWPPRRSAGCPRPLVEGGVAHDDGGGLGGRSPTAHSWSISALTVLAISEAVSGGPPTRAPAALTRPRAC